MEHIAHLHWLPARADVTPNSVSVRAAGVSDEVLMLRYGAGDDEAFRLLYARYRAPLMRFSQRLTGRASEAEEIFQETWIAVINARLRYTVRARFITWLFAIAHRRAADARRRRARHPTHPWSESVAAIAVCSEDSAQEPAQQVFNAAQQRALNAAIATLPFAQREVFLLRAETGLGLREIAAITRAPAETTKSRLRYALRELRKAMGPWA